MTSLPINSITIDLALQPRVGGLDAEHITNLQNWPENWPPLVVVKRDGKYLLVDGFHRLAAAQNIGMDTVPVRVEEVPTDGDLPSLAFALNAAHGRPLTLADRRAFAERLLRQYPELSDRETGRRSGLSSNTIGTIREDMERTAQIEQTTTRVGAGGYTYTVGTNEKQRPARELPILTLAETVGQAIGHIFSPAERAQQRQIAHYLQRLSVALEDVDTLQSWNTAEDAAQACRLVIGDKRAEELAETLGYGARCVLDVAITLGYEDEYDEETASA